MKINKKKILYAVILPICLIATILLLVAAFNQKLGITNYFVKSHAIPKSFDGYKILQISDLHCETFGEKQCEIERVVDSIKPDLVVFTGDMIDENLLLFEPIDDLCSVLSEKNTVLSCWGNHDRWIARSDFKRLKDIYSSYGIITLNGNTVLIERNGEHIAVSGADDPANWDKSTLDYVQEHGINVSPEQGYYNILLFHRANLFPYISTLGFDLVLSGHMHGGQVRIPFFGGIVSPTMEWFPNYTGGMYIENESVLIVSRGLGNAVRVPRIFNPPELVLITLKRE